MILQIILFVAILLMCLIILGRFWKFLSDFHKRNYSYCDFIFLALYFIEQLSFLLLYNLSIEYRELWVGLIVLIVTTTASMDKFMMDSRQRENSKIINSALEESQNLIDFINEQDSIIKSLKQENKSVREFIKKKLKITGIV